MANLIPKMQLNNNQQDVILPFCKSVKNLYSGVKKLYNRHVNQVQAISLLL
jgi:hypothetical protein